MKNKKELEEKSEFEKFTNLYELSKTLRFELKPILETSVMLENNNVFEKDELIKKKYQKTKVYFDQLHREFVSECLQHVELSDLEKYNEAFKNIKKITKETSAKDKKILEAVFRKEENRLRKEIVFLFNRTAKIWATKKYSGLKNKNLKILDEKAVFEKILLERYGKNEKGLLKEDTLEKVEIIDKKTGEIKIIEESIFKGWTGFTGYFTKFFETRRNFYKDDGTSSAIATRIVDQNLRRFAENIEIIRFIQKKYPDFPFKKIVEKYEFEIEEVCNLAFYTSHCVLQNGIDSYNKNFVGEFKYAINLYRQANKGVKIPYLKTLDKQILSEKEKFIDEIENNEDLKIVLKDYLQTGVEKTNVLKKLFHEFIYCQEKFDLERIYFNKKGFEQISRMWTNETFLWEEKLAEYFKKNGKKLTKKNNTGYSFPDFIPLDYLRNSLEEIFKSEDQSFWKDKYKEILDRTKKPWEQFLKIFEFEWKNIFQREVQIEKEKRTIGFDISSKKLSIMLAQEDIEANNYKVVIKEFADSLLSVYQFSKYFAVEKSKKWDDSIEIDSEFYHHLDYGFFDQYYQNSFEKIITPYNLLRNYLTKKPWKEVQKWKLNFENPTLANGWDKNKEADNFAIILRKRNEYFLGLMKKGCNHLFIDKNKDDFTEGIGEGKYEKMVYKLLPGANKMLPKVFFSNSKINFFNPSKEILEIRNHSSHTKGGEPQKGFEKKDFNLSDCHKMIEFFKQSLLKHEDWKDFDFSFSETSSYKDMNDFYREVEQGGYKISFQDISEKYIEEKNKKGELYLFQIKNKDWNKGSSGAKNLHTLYFENLFSNENMAKNFILKLNGQAEIFYRPKVSAKKLGYKEDNNKNKVVNHKRYNEDKIFFHLPITLNRNTGEAFYFNRNLNEFLASNPKINIIGIDRGEKHLAYYSVINQKEEILESGSLNFVGQGLNGEPINYHEELEKKADKRKKARKDWQMVEGIKDLKKGYISQVVRKIADLAIQYNAIIVFEDLNMRFKQIRGGIEKSIYQQLEKALIEKLNFLVNKGEKNSEKAGHLFKAYQLTSPFTTFKEMGKQTGIIFYTQANYTSKIDPVTGWRPNLYLKYSNAKKSKEDILKFDKIEFVNNRFEFTYDLTKFTNDKKVKYPQKTIWTVCSNVERFYWNKKLNNNKGGYKHYENLTEEFKNLFEKSGIDVSKNILKQINNIEVKKNETFFSNFIFLFKLLCQIRNTDEKANDLDKQDFILSPVEPFFDSRKTKEFGYNLPKNGDENGAYNIARKGIIILNKISEWKQANEKLETKEKKKNEYPELFISNQEWDSFVARNN